MATAPATAGPRRVTPWPHAIAPISASAQVTPMNWFEKLPCFVFATTAVSEPTTTNTASTPAIRAYLPVGSLRQDNAYAAQTVAAKSAAPAVEVNRSRVEGTIPCSRVSRAGISTMNVNAQPEVSATTSTSTAAFSATSAPTKLAARATGFADRRPRRRPRAQRPLSRRPRAASSTRPQ